MAIAIPDFAITTAGSSVAIAVLSNDAGTGLSIAGFTTPGNGSVVTGVNDNLIYTPNNGFFGTDNFSYTLVDSLGDTSQASVAINVVEPNQAPVAQGDVVDIFEGNEAVIPVLNNDIDPDGDSLIIAAVTMPAHGVIQVLSDQSVRYTPQPGFTGLDSFSYTISDQKGSFSNAEVAINIRTSNAPPLPQDDIINATVGNAITIQPLENDDDPEGDDLELVGYTLPQIGTLSLASDGRSFVFVSNDVGSDGFTYTVRDSAGNTASAFVSLVVERVNQIPAANDDTFATSKNTAIVLDVLANDTDPDGDVIQLVALSLPNLGTIQLQPDQTLLYTPLPERSGNDEFVYTIRDSKGATKTALVTVSISDDGALFGNGFGARRRIVIPPQTENAVLADNFVTLVSLLDGSLRSVGNGGRMQSADGFDLRFETENGDLLEHDLESFDATAGDIKVWVRIPTWDMSQQLRLFVYYDKAGVTADPSAPSSVWQGYLSRWNTVSGTDSTSSGRDLAVSQVVADELIGPAGRYDGNSVMTLGDASYQAGRDAVTVQAIVRPDAAVLGTDAGILTEGTITGSDSAAGLTLQYLASTSTGVPNVIHFKAKTNEGNAFVLSSSNRHTTESQIIHGTWRNGDVPKLYIDGQFDASSGSSDPRGGNTVATGPFYIGAGPRNSQDGGWSGLIDEVRISDRALAPEVIRTEAANLADPRLFYGVGAIELPSQNSAPPVAVPFRLQATNGESVDIAVLDFAFGDANETELSIENVGQPSSGTVSVLGDIVRYTPNSGFSGTDEFNYSIGDGSTTSTAKIQIQVSNAEDGLDPILPNGKRVLLMNEAPKRTISVTPSTIQNALNNAQPGDHFVLRNGSYGAFTISRSGTETNPIVVVADNPQSAVITSQITVRASWIKFDNLYVRGGGHFDVFAPTQNLRVDRCIFEEHRAPGLKLFEGVRNVRVSRCIGRNGKSFFIYCFVATNPKDGAQFVHIDHCYFTGYNDLSCIRFGDTSHPLRDFEIFGVLEYNYFESNTGHREMIVGKSSRNWVRYNTIVGSNRGDISIRQGSWWNIYGNYCIGAGGITVTATENRIYNNYIDSLVRGIWLMSGDNTWERTTSQRPIYDRSDKCVVANNTIIVSSNTSEGIGVGINFSQDNFPAIDCDIVNNLVFRKSGGSPLISLGAQSGNRFASNLVSANSGFTGTGVSVADPKLSLVDGIYRPTSDSPARGAGVEVVNLGPTALTIDDDLFGATRGSSFDIGAEQIGSGSAIRQKIEKSHVGVGVEDPYAS